MATLLLARHGETEWNATNERYAGAFSKWDACKLAAPTGGETDLEMAERVLEALHEISEQHEGEQVLVVTSGGPILAVQAQASGIAQALARLHFPRAGNGAVIECSFGASGVTIDA